MKIIVNSEKHFVVEGLFIEFNDAPCVFVDSSKCTDAQIQAMNQMAQMVQVVKMSFDEKPAEPSKVMQKSHSFILSTSLVHVKDNVKKRSVVSQHSVSFECMTGTVEKSGFIFKLSHLKYHATLIFRNYIREMKGLALGKTKFIFSFDREGIMQSWTRKQEGYAKISNQEVEEKAEVLE